MFNKRAIQMKVVKVPEEAQTVNVHQGRYYPDPLEIRNLAVAAGTFYAIKKAADTASKLAIYYATKA